SLAADLRATTPRSALTSPPATRADRHARPPFPTRRPSDLTYADEGTYTVTTTIKDDEPGTASVTVQAHITVTEADTLSATATALGNEPARSSASNVQVATVTSTYLGNVAGDSVATIDPGDG